MINTILDWLEFIGRIIGYGIVSFIVVIGGVLLLGLLILFTPQVLGEVSRRLFR